MIQKNFINSIRNKVKLINEAIAPVLHKDNFYRCTCPSCGSKATIIDGHRGLFKCLNSMCDAQGNVIDYIKMRDNLSYRKAIEKILQQHPELKETEEYTQNIEASLNSDLKREQLLEVNRIIENYFRNQLSFSHSKNANNYLYETRKLTKKTVHDFGIGYVTSCDALINSLLLKFDKDTLLKSGMFYVKDGKLKGKFWNRITFPITDEWNNIISFGGRVLDKSTPKYLNGPDTMLFNKRLHLFGLGQALANSDNRWLDNIIICEGYMDVISMHQAGFTNCVASLGTALTVQQCDLLKKYTDTVYLAYDYDDAGNKAANRANEQLLKLGMTVKRINLSPYKDPDEFIKENGVNSLIKRIKNAKNIIKG